MSVWPGRGTAFEDANGRAKARESKAPRWTRSGRDDAAEQIGPLRSFERFLSRRIARGRSRTSRAVSRSSQVIGYLRFSSDLSLRRDHALFCLSPDAQRRE